MNPLPAQNSPRPEAGSAVLAALTVLLVIFVAASVALFEASNRFRTSNQSSRWAEAGQAAEAGAEIALLSARNDSWAADGWSAAPGVPGTSPVTKTVTLEANVPITANISVDKIPMGATDWLRIRSQGIAATSGPARAGLDTRDNTLRKLNLLKDRNTGLAVATPQATRTVEILAEPPVNSPFQRALLLNKQFTMSGGGVIDSFNSTDPTKSTGGLYDIAKRQSNGSVGINDTQGSSNLSNTFVYGDVGYSGPAIANTANVQGTITTPFSSPTSGVVAPTWSTYNLLPSVISGTTTLTGGPQSAPARYEVSSVNVPGGNVVTIAPHAAGQESYVEIYVTGDFTTSGDGYIVQQPGVHVTYYIAGDMTVSGSSFKNQTNIAANNSVNLIGSGGDESQTLAVSGSGVFIGTLNAPGADITLSGSANFSGAVIGKTINISGGARLHYDESLAGGGTGSASYKVASWVEAVR